MQLWIAAGKVEPPHIGKLCVVHWAEEDSLSAETLQQVDSILIAEAESIVAGNADFDDFGFRISDCGLGDFNFGFWILDFGLRIAVR